MPCMDFYRLKYDIVLSRKDLNYIVYAWKQPYKSIVTGLSSGEIKARTIIKQIL
jgi:hypothetical protein